MTTRKTTRKAPGKQQYGWLKAALVTGSLAATFLGTRLLAIEDARATAVPAAYPTPIVITVPIQAMPQSSAPAASIPAAANSAPQANGGQIVLDLPPIPQVVSPVLQPPAPVASSRSSQ
ncbi:MAG TPA: hypothetical protein PLD25_01310 [Chloroflexota bacterium]|nr:hypothetical protein [Chloroflexota bacterium]HUM71251.1 hypothetical protein [Chloroflexota bacterium]